MCKARALRINVLIILSEFLSSFGLKTLFMKQEAQKSSTSKEISQKHSHTEIIKEI